MTIERKILLIRGLLRKITALERKYDKRLIVVFEAIRKLMAPRSAPPRRQIGFTR